MQAYFSSPNTPFLDSVADMSSLFCRTFSQLLPVLRSGPTFTVDYLTDEGFLVPIAFVEHKVALHVAPRNHFTSTTPVYTDDVPSR